MKKLISALVHSDDMLWSKEELCTEFGVDIELYDTCKEIAELIKQSIDGKLTYNEVYEWAKPT